MKLIHRFCRRAMPFRAMLAVVAISGLALPMLIADPVASPDVLTPDQRLSEPPVATNESEDEPTVRLNLFNKTWRDILMMVAEETGSTLIIQDLPPGSLSRADFESYTRSEAVEILNRELNPRDYRIVEKGEYLIVMSARTTREHYQPSVVSNEPTNPTPKGVIPASAEEPAEANYQGYERKFDTIISAGGQTDEGTEPGIRHADGQSMRNRDSAHPLDRRVEPESEASEMARSSDPVTLSVAMRHQTAASVARRLHEAFGRESTLITAGSSGLPAFRVATDAEAANRAQPASFEVEIDTRGNELLVTAPPERAETIAELLRDVDASSDPGDVLRVTPADRDRQWLASQLQPVLAQVDRGDNGRGGDRGGDNGPDQGDRGRDNDGPDRARDGGEGRGEKGAVLSGELPALIGNLRGEVTIESVPGMGVLILRGNDQDVQSVLKVIQTLEDLSVGQQPVIELLMLQHVDSTALAALLEEVYGRLETVRNDGTEAPSQVAAVPIVKPNSVLIVAPEGAMPAVLELARQLDRPVEPSTEFEVFPLKSALASQAATTVQDFYEEREGLGTRVTVVPVIRTNSLVVSARPRDLAEIAALILRIDQEQSALVNQIEVYELESASAEELAEVINQAIQSVLNPTAAGEQGEGGGGVNVAGGAGGEAAQQLIAARSAVIEFLDASGETPQMRKSGLLADIRVTPDPRTNSLIVTAGEQSMPFVESLIRQLDRPASATSVIKVFSLENSDATQIVDLLNTMFGIDEQGAEAGFSGIQLAGATDPGSSLIPLRFATDTRTNSVIASGSADALQIVQAILTRLDESDIRRRETTVIKLKNAPALAVAEAIQLFLTSQRELIAIDEDLVSSVEVLEREIIVVPAPVSNSLLVSATPRYYEEIREIIAELDEAPPQVIIQAMLVEVSLDNTDEFGIELGFQDSTLFDRSLTTIDQILETTTTSPNGVQTTTQQVISQSGEPGFNFNNSGPLGNNTANSPGSVGTQGLSNFALGRANADLGYGGFVFSASSANVSVLLRALSAKRTVQVLSRPQIRTLDNQLAEIQVGQNVPVVNGFVITNGIASPQVVRDDAGLILTVIPRISPDGNIVMEVAATRSEYTGEGVPIFTDTETGNTVEAPIKDITTASATVSVPTGQTIVLGGIISRSDDTIERKVPYLGDIPYLGAFFRYDSTRMQRRELLIFLTPRVIYNDADNELIKQVESDRLHFIEHEAEAIHGPLFAVPPAGSPRGPSGVPPVLGMPGYPGPARGPERSLPPGTEVLPGLPAEACPPGVYPPGTLFDKVPGPGRAQLPASGPPSRDLPGSDYSTIRMTGPPVTSGRLRGREDVPSSGPRQLAPTK